MKTLKSFLVATFLIACVACFGQDTTTVVPVNGNWFADNWKAIAIAFVAFLEAIARLLPTNSNWSILTVIMNVIKTVLPNVKNDVETHD